MKKYIIVIVLFCTAILQISAQVPGYQGKRAVVELQVMTSPLIVLSSFSESSLVAPITVKLHGEYALKRHRGIGLEYHQLNYGSDFSLKSIMLMYCRYNRDWTLAPYGRYANWGLAYNFAKSIDANASPVSQEVKTKFFSFHMNWGQRFVVAKRISLNYNFEASVPLSSDAFAENDSAVSTTFFLRLFNVNVGVGYLF